MNITTKPQGITFAQDLGSPISKAIQQHPPPALVGPPSILITRSAPDELAAKMDISKTEVAKHPEKTGNDDNMKVATMGTAMVHPNRHTPVIGMRSNDPTPLVNASADFSNASKQSALTSRTLTAGQIEKMDSQMDELAIPTVIGRTPAASYLTPKSHSDDNDGGQDDAHPGPKEL